MKKNENLLIIFAKEPIPGKVKTRLAATIGDETAAIIYSLFLTRTISSLTSDKYDLVIYKTAESSLEYFNENFININIKNQTAGDLGIKLANAFSDGFIAGYSKISIIGTDCPTLTGEDIEEAFSLLSENDLVLGPAFDGGYYLIGLKHGCLELFTNIPWSSSEVLGTTIAKSNKMGLVSSLMHYQSDIDTDQDLAQYLSINNGNLVNKIQKVLNEKK